MVPLLGVGQDSLEYSTTLAALAGRCDAVTFGTLGQRSDLSRTTIGSFLVDAPQAIRLFDVNLRQNFYTPEILDHSLRLASAAKLNEQELHLVSQLLELGQASDSDEAALLLATAYQLDWVAITRGKAGTVLFSDNTRHVADVSTTPIKSNVDSIGAGDVSCAGLLCGMLLDMPIQDTLMLANRLGAYVASQPGATPILPNDLLLQNFIASTDASIDMT